MNWTIVMVYMLVALLMLIMGISTKGLFDSYGSKGGDRRDRFNRHVIIGSYCILIMWCIFVINHLIKVLDVIKIVK